MLFFVVGRLQKNGRNLLVARLSSRAGKVGVTIPGL